MLVYELKPKSAAARFKAWMWGCSLAGIAGSNPTGGRNFCLSWVSCIARLGSLRRTYHSFRGVLPIAVCLSVIAKAR